MKTIEERIDPHTGEVFIPKRSDQIFASSKNRIDYHNELAKDERHADGKEIKQLLKNKKLLRRLMEGKDREVFYNETLEHLGFSFSCSSGYELYEGKPVQVVYEFMIVSISNSQSKILRYA